MDETVHTAWPCTYVSLFGFIAQLLAVVYGSFEEEEKKKFKKLFKHKLLVLH